MKKSVFIKYLSPLFLGLMAFIPSNAADYVAVAKNGNVYDDANAKYITVNQNNEDIAVIPGMVFATTEHTPGWYKVEYSPGIHAFIPDQITASSFNELKSGTYNVANNPGESITVEGSGTNWTANVNGKSYKGIMNQDILVFINDQNQVAYSLVDIGNEPIAINYDNSVTKFF